MKRILIDSDTGLDDALGLVHGLPKHGDEIIGITTVFGNASVEDCTAHALELVELTGTDVPVVQGAPEPLISGCGPAPQVHGAHGRGPLPAAAPTRTAQPGYAAVHILEQAGKYGSDLVIVAMGRLTNVALAYRLDPTLMHSIGRIYWMGGAVSVSGNTSAVAEANVDGDPEAAAIICASELPLTILPLDVTMDVRFTEQDMRSLDRSNHPAITHLHAVIPYYLDFYESILGVREGSMHCGLLLGIALDPTLITEQHALSVGVETVGTLTRGMFVVDRREMRRINYKSAANTSKVSVVYAVDAQRYKSTLMTDLQAM